MIMIATRAIRIGGAGSTDDDTLQLDPSFFAHGGFSQFQLISYDDLTVAPGTDLELHAQAIISNGMRDGLVVLMHRPAAHRL